MTFLSTSITETEKSISDEMFNSILKTADCDSWDLKDVVGFKCEMANYTLRFYGDAENDFNVKVDEFGFGILGYFTECKASTSQIEKMQEIILKKVEELEELEEDSNKYYEENKSEDLGHIFLKCIGLEY